MAGPSTTRPHVQLTEISKRYGGVHALRGVTLRIAPGEVHALVGENGAGKSTLSKVIAGVTAPDGGEMRVRDVRVEFRTPRDALAHGIATIAQELALVPSLTVAENVFLGSEPRRGSFVSRRALRTRFQTLADEAGFALRPDDLVGSLRTADQQKVEILRALSRGASLIIMDEPTAALSREDTARLHDVVRSLARAGRTVVLVSHFLSEVLALADTVTILRDGQVVRTGPSSAESEATLIEGMLGRTLGSVFPPKARTPGSGAETVLQVDELRAPGVDGISLRLRAGEIVGLAGLVGAGRSEFAHAVFGAAPRTGGSVILDGRPLAARSPARTLRAGVVLIPESRKEQGLLAQRSIRENTTLANLRAYSVGSWIRPGRERRSATRMLTDVTVHAGSGQQSVSSLSGGNQQKVMFARALLCGPRVLLADEPTRGVDVGSRRAIYDLLVEQAHRGLGVLVISSDLEEVLALSHRVLVIRAGRVAAELTGPDMTEEKVLTAAFAADDPERATR